jgi:hypothetical protein
MASAGILAIIIIILLSLGTFALTILVFKWLYDVITLLSEEMKLKDEESRPRILPAE